jgi:hypothetical protein
MISHYFLWQAQPIEQLPQFPPQEHCPFFLLLIMLLTAKNTTAIRISDTIIVPIFSVMNPIMSQILSVFPFQGGRPFYRPPTAQAAKPAALMYIRL